MAYENERSWLIVTSRKVVATESEPRKINIYNSLLQEEKERIKSKCIRYCINRVLFRGKLNVNSVGEN